MDTGTISAVLRHVCIHFGGRKKWSSMFFQPPAFGLLLQYVQIHMAASANVYPTLFC
jgi:membrane associated rhomboid family serine protease